ncbi:Bestrophin, partial [Trichostrongylus colubriformis]
VLVFRDVSMRVRRRFPNMDSIVAAGFLHESELQDLENIKITYNKYWAPFNWALTICTRAYKEGFIENIPAVVAIQTVDLLVPFMTILQFIFFVGWMKVAEALLNPLGEDDDDFECNFLIDKNIATGLSIVDNTHDTCPTLLPDRLSDPNYKRVYSEDSQRWGGERELVGSAEGVEIAKPDEHVRMVSIERGTSVESRRPSTLDKITDFLSMPRRRSSVFSIGQGAVHLVNYGDCPTRLIVNEIGMYSVICDIDVASILDGHG